ncbi:MAG TPA: NUDIX hydrolase [Ignavibacteriaceae bacterium]|jgi:ADP-ribose pyrophosphatase YjhB (NUDIX family)|nr:NUDIX hydrolase [Ignavibacteriaceae bacterium]
MENIFIWLNNKLFLYVRKFLFNKIFWIPMEERKDLDYDYTKSCVIPYRMNQGELEILLITSIRKKKWIFPKGFIEFNFSAFESAKKEAFEEAGVIGENETVELGSFKLKKKQGTSLIRVFSMEVSKELQDYPEKNLRKRKWFTSNDAMEKLTQPELKPFLGKLNEKLKTIN